MQRLWVPAPRHALRHTATSHQVALANTYLFSDRLMCREKPRQLGAPVVQVRQADISGLGLRV